MRTNKKSEYTENKVCLGRSCKTYVIALNAGMALKTYFEYDRQNLW